MFSSSRASTEGLTYTFRGVVIIDTVLTGTWLGRLIFQNVRQQVIYPEPDSAPEPAPSTIPRPPPFLYLGPGELVPVARAGQSANEIPESPVLTRQSGLAALVRNNTASTTDGERDSRNIPYTLGQPRQLTSAERLVQRARATLARYRDLNRTSNDTHSRGRSALRPQLLEGVPEVLQRNNLYTYIREGNIIRRVFNDRVQGVDIANDDTPNPHRQSNQSDRDGTATTTPTLTDYSRRRTRALLRRRHGSVDLAESSLLDDEITDLEGHVALRPSLARTSLDSLVEYESGEQDGT